MATALSLASTASPTAAARRCGCSVAGLTVLRRIGGVQDLLSRKVAFAVRDPVCRGLTLQPVIEPLELALLVVRRGIASETMVLAFVNQKHDILPKPPAEVVQLHALVVVHVAVRIAFFEQQRNF